MPSVGLKVAGLSVGFTALVAYNLEYGDRQEYTWKLHVNDTVTLAQYEMNFKQILNPAERFTTELRHGNINIQVHQHLNQNASI
jgi:hypothetical protein